MADGLGLWFRADVARLLAMAVNTSNRYSGDFQTGYRAAVADLVVGFGVADLVVVDLVKSLPADARGQAVAQLRDLVDDERGRSLLRSALGEGWTP